VEIELLGTRDLHTSKRSKDESKIVTG